jgi:hypothetical protein
MKLMEELNNCKKGIILAVFGELPKKKKKKAEVSDEVLLLIS